MPYPLYQPASRRFLGGGFVLLLHAGLIYALENGLAQRVVDIVQPAIQVRIITEATPQKSTPPPPPPPPVMKPSLAVVPPAQIHIATPPRPPPAPKAITRPAPPPPAPPKIEPPRAATVRVLPRIDASSSRQPEYPLAAREQGEQGTVVLKVLVAPDGRAIDATLVRSCGFELLDQAALAGVKEDYRFTPGTVDGKPQQMWRTIKFVWMLN